jgi:hypothetical protein
MGEYASHSIASYYRSHGAVHGFPKGWMSEKRPCPHCGKGVAGREEGMRSHIKLKHGIKS